MIKESVQDVLVSGTEPQDGKSEPTSRFPDAWAYAEAHGLTLSDSLYTLLREAIVRGTLAEGTKLREREVADWFNISRTPVREALRRLLAEHILGWNGKILIVAVRSLGEIMDGLRLRGVLFPLVAELVLERGRPEDFSRMGAIIAALQEASEAGDLSRTVKLTRLFDDALFETAHSATISRAQEIQVGSPALTARMLMLEGRASQATAERVRIYAAIRAGDYEAIKQAMHDHVRNASAYVEQEMSLLDMHNDG
jgi:DNA-binding GntR family transcriptional regulator